MIESTTPEILHILRVRYANDKYKNELLRGKLQRSTQGGRGGQAGRDFVERGGGGGCNYTPHVATLLQL